MYMNRLQITKQTCSGCSACNHICPSKAITMLEDERGFLYPTIEEEKCVDCGLCKKACNFNSFTENLPEERVICYAVRHKKEEEVKTSRSGAAFMALSDFVLDQSGIIFGAEFADPKTVIHMAEYTKDGVNKFKGSKYVQSDIGDCFTECADYLKNGRTVLFSGTPCQVHGLLSFLENKHIIKDNLITVDIICHGVPSRKLWREYVAETERQHKVDIVSANFRNKELFGWKDHKESFIFSDGTITTTTWTTSFYNHVMFRESCYACPYVTPHRNSDITIADYWGIENNAPEFDDDKGVNLILIHTDKGKQVFEAIKENLFYRKTELSTSMQPNLSSPSIKGVNFDCFWMDYSRLSTRKFFKKYFFPNKITILMHRVLNKTKRTIQKFFRN